MTASDPVIIRLTLSDNLSRLADATDVISSGYCD